MSWYGHLILQITSLVYIIAKNKIFSLHKTSFIVYIIFLINVTSEWICQASGMLNKILTCTNIAQLIDSETTIIQLNDNVTISDAQNHTPTFTHTHSLYLSLSLFLAHSGCIHQHLVLFTNSLCTTTLLFTTISPSCFLANTTAHTMDHTKLWCADCGGDLGDDVRGSLCWIGPASPRGLRGSSIWGGGGPETHNIQLTY